MHLLEEYTRRAAECRARAARAELPGHRNAILAVGEAWQQLAEERRARFEEAAPHESSLKRPPR